MTKWVRADHARAEKEAAVAAEREACAQLCDVVSMDHIGDIVRSKGDEIRARADTDALEAVKAEARAEALREAAYYHKTEACFQADIGATDYYLVHKLAEKHILDLIPSDQEDDQ